MVTKEILRESDKEKVTALVLFYWSTTIDATDNDILLSRLKTDRVLLCSGFAHI